MPFRGADRPPAGPACQYGRTIRFACDAGESGGEAKENRDWRAFPRGSVLIKSKGRCALQDRIGEKRACAIFLARRQPGGRHEPFPESVICADPHRLLGAQ